MALMPMSSSPGSPWGFGTLTVATSIHRRGSETDNIALLVRRRASDVQVFTLRPLRERSMGSYALLYGSDACFSVSSSHKGALTPIPLSPGNSIRPTGISTHTTPLIVRPWDPIPISSPNKSTKCEICGYDIKIHENLSPQNGIVECLYQYRKPCGERLGQRYG